MLSQAEALIQQSQYEQALQLLLPAYLRGPSSALAYTIARAYEGTRDDRQAIRFYTTSLDMKGLPPAARKHAKRRVKAIKKRMKSAANQATLSVQAPVAGALVSMNGHQIGVTPIAGILIRPGRHRISVTHPQWETWKKKVTVRANDQIHIDAEMTDKPTDILVHTDPSGAQASVGGGDPCVTPCLVPLRQGTYRVEFNKAGFAPMTHEFVKPAGQIVEVRVQLQSLATAQPIGVSSAQGYLRLDVTQTGAQIVVDGQPYARSPLTAPIALTPGAHRIAIGLAGHQVWTRNVNVIAGRTTHVPVTLKPEGGATPIRSVAGTPFTPTDSAALKDTGWALVGTGAGLLVAGVVLTALELSNAETVRLAVRFRIEDSEYVSGLTRQDVLDLEAASQLERTLSFVSYGLGAAALVTGLILATMNSDSGSGDPLRPPGLGIAPWVGPGLGGVSTTVTF